MASYSRMIAVIFLLVCFLLPRAVTAHDDYENAYVVRSGVLRAGPDYDFPRIRSVSVGRSIQVYGCIKGYEWCDVEYRGSRGWFPGDNIAFDYAGRRAPLRWVAPLIGLIILDFVIEDYWHNHYYDRSWYDHRSIWFDWHPREPRNLPVPPSPRDWPKKKLFPPPPPPPLGTGSKLPQSQGTKPPLGGPIKPTPKLEKFCPPGQVCEP